MGGGDYKPGERVRVIQDDTPGRHWLGRTGEVRRCCPSTVYVVIDGGPENALPFEPAELEKVTW